MKTLITAHENADFDAYAAMLAARRLYWPALLLFPGTQERGLQKIHSSIDRQAYDFVEPDEIKPDEIGRLVIVDTRQTCRLKHVSHLLERKDLHIEIWDHHPDTSDDLKNADAVHISSAGAITTTLVGELQKRKIKLLPEEATLLGLGIYGDTGSFTYSSTTNDDFQSAAWLLGQGMDVNKISDLAAHELTSQHIRTLNTLLESAQTYMINNTPVVLAEVSLDHYLGDFAYLAHRMMEMEKFPVLFAIGIMGDRIQVVARSRKEEINVGDVCARLGGGGHVYAASACIRSKMITEVRETILRSLYDSAGPEKTAREYMSTPAIGVEETATIRDADELMLHFGLKAVPVFHSGTRRCAGLLDAQTAARANAHGLGREAVLEYMQRRILTLPPDANIRELSEIIVGQRQRLTPIVEGGQVVGVVTRTDLINVFANDSGQLKDLAANKGRHGNVRKLIDEHLLPETRDILYLAGNLGKRLALPVYAVGGFVRDLFLGRDNQDLDLVVEGDGLAFARELARELGGRVREHQKFFTAVVIYKNEAGEERHVDVATARLEYYEYPAALPTVELSSIKMDLFRRDFSINALAVRLDSQPFGQMEDFFGGRRDIKDKIIRVLHTLSFVEDPTRCLRAVRFEQRYKFRIGPGTEKLIKNILPMRLLEKLSPQRLFNEFRHICEEDEAAACFDRLDKLGIIGALGENLRITPAKMALLKKIADILKWHRMLYLDEPVQNWEIYFYGLSYRLNYAGASDNYNRLGLPPNKKSDILQRREAMRKTVKKLLAWQKKADLGIEKTSDFCDILGRLSIECLLFLLAFVENRELSKNISLYITQWRREKPDITGDDLARLGIHPGPVFGVILKKVLDAKHNGEVAGAKSQLDLAWKEFNELNRAPK